MTPERWQQVQTVFLGALKRDVAERASFLDQVCAGDAELREEVDSLLKVHSSSGDVLDKTVGAVAAKLLAPDQSETLAGQTIGPYRVERQIGRGGMGEVYLARDTRLNRPVAIKLLPASFINDPERVRRFQQEARAASALNHPNIVTIHEVGESDNLQFIVAEFVEGRTLREILRTGPKLEQSLDVLIQTAGALTAAHNARIIHRDIKPENIMVRYDGYVKVLDFGLAKLTQSVRDTGSGAGDETEANFSELSTRTGMVMGTVRYMSPEQARGDKVDHRTDIFSLGIVLYESITGRVPFLGETPSHTIVAILEHEPPPVADYMPDAPAELQTIINKALNKKREDRYPAVSEMLSDLQDIRTELHARARLARAVSASGSDATAQSSDARTTGDVRPSTQSDQVVQQRTSGAQYIVSEIRQHKVRAAVVAIIALLVLAGFGFGAYELLSGKLRGQSLTFDKIQFSKLTILGSVGVGVIAADGRLIAYRAVDEQGTGVWVRQVATGNAVKLVTLVNTELWFLNLSPDGSFLYYVTEDRSNRVGGVAHRVPTIGGTPERFMPSVIGPVFSPDGQQLVVFRALPSGGTELLTVNKDGGDERAVLRTEGNIYSVSTDGKNIAFVASSVDAQGRYWQALEVPIGGGQERVLVDKRRSMLGAPQYLSEGRGWLLTAQDEETGVNQIWHLESPNAELRRVTRDLIEYSWLTITADGRTALVTQADGRSSIWSIPLAAAEQEKQSSVTGNIETVACAPDGKIVYSVKTNAEQAIWEVNEEGSQSRPLISKSGRNRFPAVSPDNRYILISSNRTGRWQIWRTDRDGRNATQLTDGLHDAYPKCSMDNQWVLYSSLRGRAWEVWKVSIDGGPATRVAASVETCPVNSPDGKLIAYEEMDTIAKRVKIVTRPFDGGEATQVSDSHATNNFVWTGDGRGFVYISNLDGNFWMQPLSGAAPRRLTNIAGNKPTWFDLTHDGKEIICLRGYTSVDLVLISNLK
jgi:serine/threonine protein kinase/Tol biopolymer transport system component